MKRYLTTFFLFVFCQASAQLHLDPTQLQLSIDALQQTHALPGLQVCIKDTDTETSWSFSSGYSDLKTLESLENEHLMQIGSITKSFIASLALLLEADSINGSLNTVFNIDQTIGDWLPQYPEWHSIKIKELLNMTSGIYNFTEHATLFQLTLENPQRVWQDNELVDLAYFHKPNTLFAEGTNYSYSNTNYILVGMILEKVTGLSLESLLDERIFKKYPESFKHTSYSPKKYAPLEMHLAHGYAMNPDIHPELFQKDITAVSLSWAGAAGAIISTASDVANWVKLLFLSELLQKKQYEELTSLVNSDKKGQKGDPLAENSTLMGYGLGVARAYHPDYGYMWTHTGGTLGYRTLFLFIPQKSIVLSVIINQIGPKIEEDDQAIFIALEILETVFKIVS